MQVVGASGRGKSKFLENMIRQDLLNPRKPGVLLIDPHGSLYDDVVTWCASQEIDKLRNIHLFNPSSENWLMGFNPLHKDPLTSESVHVDSMVNACAQVWGGEDTRGTPLLLKCLRAVFYSLLNKGYTLVEATALVTSGDPDRVREFFTTNLDDSVYQALWNDFNSMSRKDFKADFSSTNNRLVEFLSSPVVRNIVGQQECSIDFRECIENGDVVLCNLSASTKMSRDNARLLGTLILNNVFLTALGRKAASPHPQPFYVYIDECYRYLTKDIESMLDETRKFGVHLILAHQRLGQLRDAGKGIYNAIKDGAQTKVVFGGMNSEDAIETASDIFLGELNLEQGVEVTKNPMVIDQVITWLESESDTHSTSKTETEGSSESTSSSYGMSVSDGDDSVATLTESDSGSSGTSGSTSFTEGRSHTEGRSQTFQNVYDDRYSSVHGLDKILHMAAVRISTQSERKAIVKTPSKRTAQIKIGYVTPPIISEDYTKKFHERLLEKSKYTKALPLVEKELKDRADSLLKLSDMELEGIDETDEHY